MNILAQASQPAAASGGLTLQGAMDAFKSSIMEMVDSVMKQAPYVLVGIILVLFGWFIFRLVQRLIVFLLRRIGADAVVEKMGVGGMLRNFGIKAPFTDLFGKTIFWLLMLQFVMICSEQLGLGFVTDPLNGIVEVLPSVISAVIIFIVGYIVSDLIRGMIFKSGERIGLDYAKALSNLVHGFIFVVVIILAVRQLGIETSMLENAVSILLGAVALAVALALGLGLHGLAKSIVSGVYAREIFPTGSKVEHDGEQTTVAGVGAVSTRLEKADGSFVMIPNDSMVGSEMKGSDRS